MEKPDEKKIQLESIKDQLPDFEEKKELYKLRHYLHYHVVKKKKSKETFEISHKPTKISFD